MKRLLFLILALVMTANALFGYAYLLDEGFEGSVFPPEGWTLGPNSYEHDYYWNWQGLVGGPTGNLAGSVSWAQPDPYAEGVDLHPDNWLISPLLDLTTGGATPKTLNFNYSQTDTWYNMENLTVYISTSGNTPGDFLGTNGHVLWTQRLTYQDDLFANGWSSVSGGISMAAYTGNVYIAFRHWDCGGGDMLLLDNITIHYSVEHDLSLISISSSTNSLDLYTSPGGITITGSIKNEGLQTATGYTVSLYSVGLPTPIYTTSTTPSLPVGSTFPFTHTYPPPVGRPAVYLTITYAADLVLTNNTSQTITFEVYNSNLRETIAPIGTADGAGNYPTITPSNSGRYPFDFYRFNSVHQTIYFPQGKGSVNPQPMELGTEPKKFVGIAYSYIQDNIFIEETPIKVYIGPTTQNLFPNMAPSDWVRLDSNHKLVYDGDLRGKLPTTADPAGVDVWLDFLEPYYYDGQTNIVITTLRIMDNYTHGVQADTYWKIKSMTAQQGGSQRTIYRFDDFGVIDESNYYTYTPTLNMGVPIIKLLVDNSSEVALTGIVTQSNGTTPIAGVTVGMVGSPLVTTVTDAQGRYTFPAFNVTNAGIYANASGYTTYISPILTETAGQAGTVEVTEPGVWTFNFNMGSIPTQTVTGVVKAEYNSTGLEGITVKFHHRQGGIFEAVTIGDGTFTTQLPQNETYGITIDDFKYVPYVSSVVVATSAVTVPEIVLVEKNLQPIALKATDVGGGKEVSWMSAYTPTETFTYATLTNYVTSFHIGYDTPFIAFSRFDAAQMLDGLSDDFERKIYRVAFMPMAPPSLVTYIITIIRFPQNMSTTPSADYPAYNTGYTLYTQPVAPHQIIPGQICYIDLDRFVDLTSYTTGQIWVGISITNPSGVDVLGGYLINPDTYRGDIYYMPEINEYGQLGTQYLGNWLIATYTVDVVDDGRGTAPVATQNIVNPVISYSDPNSRMISSSHIEYEVAPLRDANRPSQTRLLTNYELYRLPLSSYNDPVSHWGAPVASNLTDGDVPYLDARENLPNEEWVYGLVAVYNLGDTTFEIKSDPIYSPIQNPSTATVTITVLDEDSVPVLANDVTLMLTNSINQAIQFSSPTYTNNAFVFTGVPYGIYHLYIGSMAFQSQSMTLNVFSDNVSETLLTD